MERLTERTGEGQAIPRMDLRRNGHQRCMERLAEYEDTGLTPEEIMAGKLQTGWIPVEEPLPEDDKYILLSFENFTVPLVGHYEKDEEGGAFYLGDEDESCVSYRLFVIAWMPLPEPYKPKELSETRDCFTPEEGNPYPLCTGNGLAECEDCQLRADWEPEDPYGVER